MIHVAEHHQHLLHLWRTHDARGIRLVHVDFHDDLRGLLIDRAGERAYPVGDLARGTAPLDEGNFLAHAVLEGRLREVRWVHDLPGGRAWDTGIVRYRTDLAALPHRIACRLAGRAGLQLAFSETTLATWDGLRPGEHLSLDWDCFASRLQDEAGIPRRVDAFLERLGNQVPPESFLAFSHGYCHPSVEVFRELARTLERRFDQPLVWHPPALRAGEVAPGPVVSLPPRNTVERLILALRRRGVF